MSDNYKKWIDRETAWVKGAEEKLVKQFYLVLIAAPAAASAVMAAIAIIAGGGVKQLIINVLFGLGLGLLSSIVAALTSRSRAFITKKYLDHLEQQIANNLTEGEKEEFFLQMSDQQKVKEFICERKDKTESRVAISKDYLWYADSRVFTTLVKLREVERMELDSGEFDWTTRSDGLRVTQIFITYYLKFYYKNSGKKDADAVISFDDSDTRDRAAKYLQSMNIGK